MRLIVILATFLLLSSNNPTQAQDKSSRWLEDIPFDASLDDGDFEICDGDQNIVQYFNLGDNIEIVGGKPKIISHFNKHYKSEEVPQESGLIRIRFVVNCKGETDRFRLLESDLEYREKTFDLSITSQLLELTKSLTGWKQKYIKEFPTDYYQYLIFKIVDGQIIKILP